MQVSEIACKFAGCWVVSSVGLEHRLDRAGVTGSNPVQPTVQVLFGLLAQGFRALSSHGRGHWFKSSTTHSAK